MIQWLSEEIFFDSKIYFDRLFKAIHQAKENVLVETYIIENDLVGKNLIIELLRAHERGVIVKLLVDAIGSLDWVEVELPKLMNSGINIQLYHPLPWPLTRLFPRAQHNFSWKQKLAFFNHRNHRKICIIDHHEAWIGSVNFSSVHYQWRDTSIYIRGEEISKLEENYNAIWNNERTMVSRSSVLKFNDTKSLRTDFKRELIKRIITGKKIWITNPYFIPILPILRALCYAAENQADVRLLFPKISDVKVVKWVSLLYYKKLLHSGVKIFEYRPCVLHAKTIVIDDWAIVGTSNMNHRSFIYDLEVDVVVTHSNNREILKNKFEEDLLESDKITLKNGKGLSLLEILLGWIFSHFKRWF